MTSPNWKIREPPTKLGGQIKLVHFVPESIVPNTVEGFLDIYEGPYYMFTSIEAFHDGLRETKKVVACWLGFSKAWLVLIKETIVFQMFSKWNLDGKVITAHAVINNAEGNVSGT